MAHALAARGLVRGDRLCVHLANRVEFLELFLACVRAGVIFVPMNVLYREREIAHITADADPKFSITTAEHLVVVRRRTGGGRRRRSPRRRPRRPPIGCA